METTNESQKEALQPAAESHQTVAPAAQEAPKRVSLFIEEQKLDTVQIGGDNWVKIPARYPFSFIEKFRNAQMKAGDKIEDQTVEMQAIAIKEWNLVQKDGVTIAPITEEYIRLLPAGVVSQIDSEIGKRMQAQELPKVNAPSSSTL